MQVHTRDADAGRAILSPVGEVDMSTVGRLETALLDVLDRSDVRELVVDLSGVSFLDSTGVAALLRGAAEAVGRGATLRVADPQPVVARVLRITAVGPLLGLPDADVGPATGTQPGWRRLG